MSKKKKHKFLCHMPNKEDWTSTPANLRVRPGVNIPEQMILDIEEPGLFLGMKSSNGKGFFVGKSSAYDGNAIAVGINGSGKSHILAKSTIETWGGPFVALDIKGELSKHYDSARRKGITTRPYIIFDPANSFGVYDVYSMLNKDDQHFVQYIREIAHAIIPMPPDVREAYWINMARDILSSAIIFFFTQGFTFIDTMIALQSTSISEVCRKIQTHGCAIARMFISEIGSLKPEQRSSIGTELKQHTVLFATDEYIQSALSSDENMGKAPFSWTDVARADEPVNVFLCIEQDKLEQWSGMIRLLLTQLVRTLERRPEKHSLAGDRCPPLLVLLDEFPLLGRMDIITSALTTLRSKKVTFYLMIQSIPQLDLVYGSNARRIILDNCQYKAILKVTETDSQEYLSKLIGTVSTGLHSYSQNYDPFTEKSTFGKQLQEHRQPLIHPHEFACNEDIWLHTPYGFLSTVKLPVKMSRLHVFDYEKMLEKEFEKRGYYTYEYFG